MLEITPVKAQTMKEKILKTLEAYYITNKEVLSDFEIKDLENQISYMKNMIKEETNMKTQIKNATAIYTGGGVYIYYGQLTDGNWFRACDDWEGIEICDSDTSVEEADYNEFYEEHTLKILDGNEYKTFWNEMLLWIIHNIPEGNYQVDDLENRMIKEEN